MSPQPSNSKSIKGKGPVSSGPSERTTKSKEIPSCSPSEILKSKEAPTTLFLVGKSEVRATKLISAIEKKWFKDGKSEVRRIDLATLNDMSTLRADLQTFSLFSTQRAFTFLRGEDIPLSRKQEFVQAANHRAPGVLIMVTLPSFPKTHPLRGIEDSGARVIELSDLEPQELESWTARELRDCGVTEFENAVPSLIVRICGDSPDLISIKVAHLALYCDGGTLSCADVRNLFSEPDHSDEFEVLSLLNDSNPAKMELLLNRLLKDGRNEFGMLGLISRAFSNYFIILSGLAKGEPTSSIQSKMKLPPWIFNKTVVSAQRYKLSQIETHLREILRCDLRLKGRSLGAENALIMLTEQLRSVRHRG